MRRWRLHPPCQTHGRWRRSERHSHRWLLADPLLPRAARECGIGTTYAASLAGATASVPRLVAAARRNAPHGMGTSHGCVPWLWPDELLLLGVDYAGADRRVVHTERCSREPRPGLAVVELGPTPAPWRSAPFLTCLRRTTPIVRKWILKRRHGLPRLGEEAGVSEADAMVALTNSSAAKGARSADHAAGDVRATIQVRGWVLSNSTLSPGRVRLKLAVRGAASCPRVATMVAW